MAKGGKANVNVTLETTTVDSHFAMATTIDPITLLPVANPAFDDLLDSIKGLEGGPYDYVYVSGKAASNPAHIEVGASLAALNGAISTGNGKDTVDLSVSTGNNFVSTGNGMDDVQGGAGNDIIKTGNAKDDITGGADLGVFSQVTDTTDPENPVTTTTFTAGDVLSGGNGPDTFHYALGDGVDEITDFRVGQDTLVLDNIDEADLVHFVSNGDLFIGISDGAGGVTANSVIVLDNVTDFDAVLDKGLLFT
jgi:Ca2+-binding RTX toxin-like protein